MADIKFEGWLGHNPESAKGKMEWGPFEPKKWTEDDVDIEVSHCGICGSDLHMLSSGWFPTNYPCCVGHEIVGKAVRVGNNVKHVKVGDRVGVGAQSRTCQQPDCPECSSGNDTYCTRVMVNTYGSLYPNNEGKSYGGYADYNRSNQQFVVQIPDGLSSADAAPMLCGGVTVYSPLRRNGCGPGKSVGIIGVGGLGHFAVLFAKAMGADRVVGISRKNSKRADVLKLGADEYIATDEDQNWHKTHHRTLDLIICTANSVNMPIDNYIGLLKRGGEFVQVGAADNGDFPKFNIFSLLGSGAKISGSSTGAPWEIKEMLQLAADKKIKPWIEERPMKEANQAIIDMEDGKARYRYVLVNENFGKHGTLNKLKPKNARSKRALEKKAPKIIENPKSTLFLRGTTCSQIVQDALADLHSLRQPLAKKFSKKNDIHPFEDPSSLVFFSEKNDTSLLVFGSSSKKRPNTLTLARTFATNQILDMIELHIIPETFRTLSQFKSRKFAVGLRPMMLFSGTAWDSPVANEYTILKSFLIDMFKGDTSSDKIDVEGLQYLVSVAADEPAGDDVKPTVHLRLYLLDTKRSGQRLPRIELEEMGPRMDFRIGRSQQPDEAILKEAMKKPKAGEEKTKKNISTDVIGDKIGRIHLGKQDLSDLQTRKMKGLKRNRDLEGGNGTVDEDDTQKRRKQ
ncbi:hypothetical protein GQX73_g8902 [Xylaria multiplex]|uniref:Ribosome production factor 2 homolog n=1 Tax=Xylaria multiplex TaxID=323545 RepID=A0A7C8N248_9PEZI|nr:hypothetical protein GQX73_g8902 [Xylaria multiplex]